MFNVFKKVLTGDSITQEDADKVSDFIFLRWLSGNENLIELANALNEMKNTPEILKLKMVQSLIKGKIRYIPYPKTQKGSEDKDIKYIMEFYNISRPKAQLYGEFISHKDLENIKEAINSKYAQTSN